MLPLAFLLKLTQILPSPPLLCVLDILLSLVRTKAVGHIRDVRRLVVAMSRARYGLYVFCRKSLFMSCYELTPSLEKLIARPDTLQIVPNETWPSQRSVWAQFYFIFCFVSIANKQLTRPIPTHTSRLETSL